MAAEVIMPMLGLAQETGKVVRWLKTEGATVVKGEPLLEIETDKVTVELEAPADGTLVGVTAHDGDEVPVGEVIARVRAAGEPAANLPTAARATAAAPSAAVASPAAATAAPAGNGARTAVEPAQRVLASPKARRLASERGLRIEEIAGSGPYGAVVARDVDASVARGRPPARPAVEGLPVSSAWQTMARRMQENWQQVPHFYLSRDVDASRLESWRASVRRRVGYEGVTHTDLLVKIAAAALADHPRVNAAWRDGRIETAGSIDIGIAVATDDALIVPVLHDAGRLELREIAERRADLVERARGRRLRPEDVSGGTFTISNLGMYGVDAFAAVVNAPQAAILAVGRIADRIVAVDGAAAVRPICTLTLSLDHRTVDGATGARFLDTLATLVEEPAGLVN